MNIFYAYAIPILLKFLNSRSTECLDKLMYALLLISLAIICYFTNPIVCLCLFVFTTIPGAILSHIYFSGRLHCYFNSQSDIPNISQSQHQNEEFFESTISDETEVEGGSNLEVSLSHFTELLLNNFISEWYSSLSECEDFPDKCYPNIFLALSNLCERAHSLPLTHLSTHLLMKGLVPFFSSLEEALGESKCEGGKSLIDKLQHARTLHSFEASEFAHPALRNSVATHKYAEHIFDTLLQASDLSPELKNSFLFRSFLRDVISTSFLQKLFDVLSKPHFIYQCLAFAFSLQFNSNSNLTQIQRYNPHRVIAEDANREIFEDSISVARVRKPSQSKKIKSCDFPDRFGVKKHFQFTNTACDIDTLLRVKRAEMTMIVPLRARRDSVSIFDHEVVREPNSSPYYVYSIWVPDRITNRSTQSEGVIVKHRFREFEQLYRTLSSKFRDLMRGISFPSKISQIRIGGLTPHFIMRRRMLLENFLKAVCVRDQLLQVPDLQAFLGLSIRRKQEMMRQNSRISRAGNNSDPTAAQSVEDVVLKLRVFVTKHLLYANDSSDIVPSQNIRDSESLVHSLPSQHPTNLLTSLQDDTSPSSNDSNEFQDNLCGSKAQQDHRSIRNLLVTLFEDVLNGADVESENHADNLMGRFPFTSSLYLFGITALRNKQLWIQNETFYILLLQMLGRSSSRSLQTKMEGLNTSERMCDYFGMLEKKFFPNGKLKLFGSNPPSKEELERLKSTACGAIYNFLPELIKDVAGEDELRRTIYYCLDCLSNPDVNRHLLLRLFDIILLYLVPEVTAANFQRVLGVGIPF